MPLLLLPAALSANVLILRATGPSAAGFAPGKSLPDTARIVLRAGDHLLLLDPHGTRDLTGPGSFTAADDHSAARTSLVALAGTGTERRARIGAVRGVQADGGPAQRPNIWFVDTAAAGNACIAAPGAVTLWRAGSETAGTTTIVAPGGGIARVDWIKGQASQPWPVGLPVTAEGDYRLTGTGTVASGTSIRFRLIDRTPTDLQGLAGALIAQGCQGQIDILVATTPPTT